MTDFVTHLLSQYAPSDKPITTAELLKIGIQKVPTVFADDPVTASRMTQRLAEHLMTVRGHGEDALAAQMQAIEQARKAGDDAQLVDATSFLADIQIRLVKTDDASKSLKEAADLLQKFRTGTPAAVSWKTTFCRIRRWWRRSPVMRLWPVKLRMIGRPPQPLRVGVGGGRNRSMEPYLARLQHRHALLGCAGSS